MKNIKINFADFWGHFDKTDNYFYRLLSKRFMVEISNQPDFLIYTCYGNEYLSYGCYRIFYNGENMRVNWRACDYALSFDYLPGEEKHYRLPNWIWYDDPKKLTLPKPDAEQVLRSKTGFCNMVVSNGKAKERIRFFDNLSRYKKVDSGGKYLNNIGGAVKDKRSFINRYKFSIAFENSSYPGYTTEKLVEPMMENSLPLYWGNPEVDLDFNARSFLNYHDFPNEKAFIDRIIELDNNDALYIEMMQQPWFRNNRLPQCLEEDRVLDFFEKIFQHAQEKKPVAVTAKGLFHHIERNLATAEQKLNARFKYRKGFR